MSSLRYTNPAHQNALKWSRWSGTVKTIPPYIEFAIRRGNDVNIPRGTLEMGLKDIQLTSRLSRFHIIDESTKSEVDPLEPQIEFNDAQKEMLEAFETVHKPFGNYLLQAPTGGGKQIGQLAIANMSGQRTLLLYPTNLIKNTGVFPDLKKAFNLKRHDIGVIQGREATIGDRFTIASIATLRKRRDLWPELYRLHGTIIFDEVAHIITQPLLYPFIRYAQSKYLIGTTATLKEGKMAYLYLKTIFGKPTKRIGVQNVETTTNIPLKDIKVTRTNFVSQHTLSGTVAFTKLMHELKSDSFRNQQILNNVMLDYNKGKVVLLVTRLKEHANMMYEALIGAGVEDANILTGDHTGKGQYTEQLVQAVNERTCRIVVATLQAVMIGANLNPVDRLHLTMPVADTDNLEQLIGRIRRKAPGKKDCQMVYYLDRKDPYLSRKFIDIVIPVAARLGIKDMTKLMRLS